MTHMDRYKTIIERISSIEARLDLIDTHLTKNLDMLTKKTNAAERQLYAMYIVGGVHLMLMGFVLKHIFG